jgi:hypothetical protein
LKLFRQMRKRYFLLPLLLALRIIIFVTVFALYHRAHRAVVAARPYVYDTSRLRIGVSGVHEFDRIRDKYSRFAETTPNCADEECIAKFKFANGSIEEG